MNSGNLLRHSGFLRLLAGTTATLLGDQFTMIAIPWLVLRLTHDSMVLGTVMACVGFPRVLLLMVAGVLVDRYSPRSSLIASSVVGSGVLITFGSLVLAGAMSLHLMYAFAVVMGVVGSFAIPARMSILPRLVEPAQLQAANSMMMAASQGAILLGPILAGLLSSTPKGLAIAFLVDGSCFLIAAFNVPRLTLPAKAEQEADTHLLASIFDGIKWLFGDRTLRTLTCYWATAALIASGPVQVGLPVLVQQQLGMGSAAFGILISVNGFGQLAGVVISGLKWLKAIPLGIAVCLIDLAAGLAMFGMGVNHLLAVSIALMLTLGVGMGFVQVSLYTWIQNRIPKHLLGRIISILTLIMTGISPLSALLTGVLTHYISMPQLFVLGGMLLSSFALVSVLTSRTIRSVQAVS
ncbi:MFS transporter [Dyella flagellata]|uniref:MFS transporter n=1 Tax=Dyella flagellata TaxID=1867833 RepID=A0ABQ5XAW1_9GAMM|nr:MFS transporter [Dyella flagellata]GLQ87763.1 MFS transporter [Dyella flagellata]